MSKLITPEADFYEILQERIDQLQSGSGRDAYGDGVSDRISELKHMQQNFSSYMYKLKHKSQAD